jgi:hypothetical protein
LVDGGADVCGAAELGGRGLPRTIRGADRDRSRELLVNGVLHRLDRLDPGHAAHVGSGHRHTRKDLVGTGSIVAIGGEGHPAEGEEHDPHGDRHDDDRAAGALHVSSAGHVNSRRRSVDVGSDDATNNSDDSEELPIEPRSDP